MVVPQVIVSYEAAAQKHEKRIHGLKPNQTVRWVYSPLAFLRRLAYREQRYGSLYRTALLAANKDTISVGPAVRRSIVRSVVT